MLTFDEVAFSVPGRELFTDVSLALSVGSSVSITGPSGTGKSTLLSLALGMNRPARGTVEVVGVDLAAASRKTVQRLRRQKLGMVFQAGELIDELTPVENVAVAGLIAGLTRAAAYDRSDELLRDLKVDTAAPSTGHLSGGERQRVAVARALVNRPVLVLADEPTGALDPASRDAVAEILFDLPQRRSCALVVVAHDEAVAERADHMFELRKGRLKERPALSSRP